MPVTEEVETFLEHFGKKGMKWGVRKRSSSGGGATSGEGKPKAAFLSDADLKKRIERMNLEKQYTNLSTGKTGNPETKDFVKGLGKNLVSMAVMAVATQQVGKILKGK